ncbi:MAG TPA: ATP-binding protein [Miltoncostaeaceae bacterium]|nr:ATP-binding protein [Miltoncostaeaceae bacterium]
MDDGMGAGAEAVQLIHRPDVGRALSSPAAAEFVLRADRVAPRSARVALRRLALGSVAHRLLDVLLCVGEAISNAVRHAYPPGSSGEIVVKAWTHEDGLAVLVQDRGRGFDPDGDPSREGVGLRLMRRLADVVSILSRPGGGTAVLMVFRA